MASVTSRGYAVNYETMGDGPALVFVSGLSQWAEQWVDAGYVSALAASYRLVRIDPLGHGGSDKPHTPEAYRWQAAIDDLIAVVDAEGLDRPMWWGFSWGADLVKDLAHLHPDRAAAVVLGSVASPGPLCTAVPFPEGRELPELIRAEGGLEQFWAALGYTAAEQVAVGRSMNDIEALACVYEGMLLDPELEFDRLSMPVLAYKGMGEVYSQSMVRLADGGDIECHDVPALTHFDAFQNVDDALAVVLPFLHRHAT